MEREVDASANPRRVESSRSDGWNGGESERTSKQDRGREEKEEENARKNERQARAYIEPGSREALT